MVPVLIDQCKLDSNLLFLDKNGKPFSKYMLADNLDWYTLNYNKVIDFISERNNYERITIIGGSQGARIALELALNESITGLVFMNCDPLGRIASRIDAEYSNLETRNINRIESYLNIAKCKTNTLDSLQMNDTQYSWMSFSKPCLLTFAVLNIPTLIVYSDRDSNCPNCYVYDLLPNYKSNIELLKCPGLNHFQIDSEGINHEDSIFEEVNRWMNLKNQIK
jgi:pimeloyl-ACP methyl ester carboxylesterase